MDSTSTNTLLPHDARLSDTFNASETDHVVLQASLLTSTRAPASPDVPTTTFEDQGTRAEHVDSTFVSPHNMHRHRAVEEHGTESAEASQDATVTSSGSLRPLAASMSLWQPTYLRRRVLAAFSFVFLVLIAALESLVLITVRNDGIAKGDNKYHYLWTYGPTALLTLIAALFNRVEYQAKLMAPWERLFKHPEPAEKNLLLDYISPLQPYAIYQSLRNKDISVAATSTVSLVIKILIILSSGLFTLSRIEKHHATIPLEIQTDFVDDSSNLQEGNNIPYFIMQGLIAGSGFPLGVAEEFAYQSVRSKLSGTARYQATVDGLKTNLQCQNVDLEAGIAITGYGYSFMNLNFTSPDCDVIMTDFLGPSPPFLGDPSLLDQVPFGKLEPVRCQRSLNDADKRVLVMFGLEEWFVDGTTAADEASDSAGSSNAIQGKLVKSTQLLCSPQYEIIRVNLVHNGDRVESAIIAGESSDRTLDHVSPSDFMSFFFSYGDTKENEAEYMVWNQLETEEGVVVLNDFMHNAMETADLADINLSMLYDTNFIQSIATRYYQQLGAVVAKEIMMGATSLNATGSGTIMEDRLVAREWAVQVMVALISICLILSLLTIFMIPKIPTLHQSPSTLHGIAALIARSPDILGRLCYSGDSDSKTLHHPLRGSTFQAEVVRRQSESPGRSLSPSYMVIRDAALDSPDRLPWTFLQSKSPHQHPWVLHPASRLSLGLILVALITTLELILRQSRSHEGLGNVGDNAYIHYTWTSLPALIFGGLAMMFSSMDFSMRSLAPYTILSSNVVTGEDFKILDFLNMSVPSAMFREAKFRNIGALATTSKLLVASFFTVFSGSLFQDIYYPSTTVTQLRADNSFGPPNVVVGVAPAMILFKNWSYPSFTYEDLAFPQFLPEVALADFSNASLVSIQAVVPALRSRFECRMYDASTIRVQIETSLDENDAGVTQMQDYLMLDIDDEGYAEPEHQDHHTFAFKVSSNTSYFGTETDGYGYSQNVFIWGKKASFPQSQVKHIAAMGCNQSAEVVDAETVFIGADLAIDADNPPQVVPNTERPLVVPPRWWLPTFADDVNIPVLPQGEALNTFFTLLTQSRYAIPRSTLGGGYDDAVAAAIKFQHGIFFAQALNEGRVPAAETNVTLSPEQISAGDTDAGHLFEAIMIDGAGKQRVVQDAVSTRVLEALLLVTLILLGVGWVWLPRTDILPKRSPTTVASAVALLAGGNLVEWLGEEGNSTSALGGRWDTTKFWMGWGTVPDEEGILMGNENENGISRFGIFAVNADYDDLEQTESMYETTAVD